MGLFGLTAVSFLFFDRIWPVIFLIPGLFFFLKRMREKVKRKEVRYRLTQFRQLLSSLSTAMAAGQSLEKSVTASVTDLEFLYGKHQDDCFMEALRVLVAKLRNGISAEVAFLHFSDALDLQELRQFSFMLHSVKRHSGDLLEAMRKVSQMISDKIEIHEEIQVMIAQKKLEAKLILAMPFIFLAVLKWTAAEYVAPLYQTMFGHVMMTASLAVILAAYLLTNKWVNIEL